MPKLNTKRQHANIKHRYVVRIVFIKYLISESGHYRLTYQCFQESEYSCPVYMRIPEVSLQATQITLSITVYEAQFMVTEQDLRVVRGKVTNRNSLDLPWAGTRHVPVNKSHFLRWTQISYKDAHHSQYQFLKTFMVIQA